MGVDWLSCKYCGETFPDCGDYVYCECGTHWCSQECAEEDGYQRCHCKLGKFQENGYPEEDCEFAYRGRCDTYKHECEYWLENSCKYCREEDFEDTELLEFALEVLGVTRSEFIEDYKKKTRK